MAKTLQRAFEEAHILRTLLISALAAHLLIYFVLMWIYGPCAFFLSSDCTVTNNDTQHYVILAENMTHGHGYSRFMDPPYEPDALRTPLMPLYFVPFTYFGGYSLIWLAILLLNLILSLGAPLVYKIARFFLPHTYALAAGFFMAFEPLYLYRSQIAEPDAILVLLVLASIYFIIRSWHRESGPDIYRAAFLLGFAILAKPSALYLTAVVFIFEAFFLSFLTGQNTILHLKRFGIAFLITSAVVLPWIFRNAFVFGIPALSSIQGYNLYQYYTAPFQLPGEKVPVAMQEGSREPSRYLPYQNYFTHVAIERIKAHPKEYARDHLVGMLRNLFVSDISQIYYYGHSLILPFPYDPESKTNIHALLLQGDISGMLRALFQTNVLPKILWFTFLGLVYICAGVGWIYSSRESKAFLAFTMFLFMYGYLLLGSGPFVDAKYRLPALPLVLVLALYGVAKISRWRVLRVKAK